MCSAVNGWLFCWFFCCLFSFESISNAFLIRFLTSFVVVDFAVLVIGATTTTTITKITAATRAKLLIHFHAPPSLVVYLYNKQKKKDKDRQKKWRKNLLEIRCYFRFFQDIFLHKDRNAVLLFFACFLTGVFFH